MAVRAVRAVQGIPKDPAAVTAGDAATLLPADKIQVNLHDLDRETAIARLFNTHYVSLVRLAALLGADDPEDIAAQAFYELYRRWRKLRDSTATLPYLRSIVCNLTRMRLRHLQVVRKNMGWPSDQVESAETQALLRHEQRAVVVALQRLSPRQREALVLRYWLDLKESEIAAVMGISCGAVKSHVARGMTALSRAMESQT
ncbi:DNA-directed RNA polymerase specialized sigma subunit, sigma24 [Frankia casuarinae]|jgi:RNA polymerase sigma factor (sigma-70 family)|nr:MULTISPECIES: sigma-70 family RNA polymerase sigma factor [Frankia]ETA00719.1 DNA-directed RNA polymerase specialized sigma subunit, sigma24 [Frankia sp. CcI6]KEZ35140.1 RNA polymerase sigma factor, sigma-70 family [Frankia sp. CeD]KFB03190.1 RNA polymerase sigma factor, sigma-70 family [Frankia sp. Allo2]TFE27715.1 sigma-70 family RNA polymerase sigma factor [Frankia sp. B2]EYT90014.1 DNA-directed RNA polymerase specialized sigma subunit, sigma24 [Frankia casuarinae]